MLNHAPGRDGLSRLAPQGALTKKLRGRAFQAQRTTGAKGQSGLHVQSTKVQRQTPCAWSVECEEGRAQSKAGEMGRETQQQNPAVVREQREIRRSQKCPGNGSKDKSV